MSSSGTASSWPELPDHAGASPLKLTEPEAVNRVLAEALGWLEANIEWFAPQRWEKFLRPRPFRPGPLLELLGLVRVLLRSRLLTPDEPLVRGALDLAEEAAHDDEFERTLSAGDELFPYHLNLVGLLESLGRPLPHLRARCESLLAADAGAHARPYKPVLNRLELRYFADRGGFPPPERLPEVSALYEQSIAALGPDVLQLTDSETYALTHVVFYATDFGRHSKRCGGPERLTRLYETVEVLLGVHLARGDLDLTAELLLCERTLRGKGGQEAGGLAPAGWNTLAAAARPDGALPSPVHRPEVMAGLDGDKAAAYLFGTCYHTTLAAALAAAAYTGPSAPAPATRRGEEVGTVPDLPRADAEAVLRWAHEACEATAVTDAERPVWQSRLRPLLVLGIRARDATAAAEVLRAARNLGMERESLVRSASALLAARHLYL